jgi:hypothetical protein
LNVIHTAEYCNNCNKKLNNRDYKYKHSHHRGYCRTCLRKEFFSLLDSFEDGISKILKKISHKLTSEEVQNIERMIEIDRVKKEIKSLEDKKRILKKTLSLDEKELEYLRIDTTFFKIRIDEIKREIRIRRGDIDGLMININIDFEDLLKKMKKNIDDG